MSFPKRVASCFAVAAAMAFLILLSLGDRAQAQTWSLADDFSLGSNPNGAWIYQLEVTAGDGDTAYTPLNTNTRDALSLWGTAFATPPTMRSEASGYWGIGRNDTGVAQVAPNVIWHPGDVLFHPKLGFTGSGGRFVATWVAPGDMTVNADWAYQVRSTGSDGVGLGVLHESGGSNTVLRGFANPEGATGTFSNLNVLAGDKLHFRFDNWPAAGGDITWADINIAEVSATPPAGTIFSENFNGYVGNQNATQFETGLEVAVNGNVSGWLNSGAGTMHAVDLNNLGGQNNPSDWAIMLWENNVITSSTIADSNFLGTEYELTFDYGTGVYAGPSQETMAGDSILIEVLRDDNSVLESMVFEPGAWGDGNRNLEAGLLGTIMYTGDGTGNIHLRFGPDGPLNSGHFEGAIDNVVLRAAAAVPEPASVAIWSLVCLGLAAYGCFRKRN